MTDRDEPASDRAEPEPPPEAGGIRLVNLGGAVMLPALAAGVREAGLCLGLDPAPANALQIACQLMMRLIAAANIREGRLPHFELEVLGRPGAVIVRIDDEGLPYELSDLLDRDAGEDITLLSAVAGVGQLVDEFNYTGRGRLGNRIELVKGIRPDPLIENLDRGESSGPELPPDAELEVRPMTGGDAIGFARDVYRSYGYTYDNDWAYRAGDIRQMLADGTLAGWVVTTPEDGRLIGHIAVRRTTGQDRVGHVGLAMIDPQARRRNLGTQLGVALIKWALDQRMYGVWGEATTIHPYSQRGMLATGGHELALLMSFIPARVNYAAMASHTRRIAVMIAYVRLDDNPVHRVFAPPQHAEMLRRIYEANQLAGEFAEAAPELHLEPSSTFDVALRSDHNTATIDVRSIGVNLVEVIRGRLARFRRMHLAAAYVDLPLSLPATAAVCSELEELGLFFGGVIPVDDERGFRLRLQYLIDADVERDDITVASDLGGELRDYVWARCPEATAG